MRHTRPSSTFATLRIDQARLADPEKLSREALALDLQRKANDSEHARSTLARAFEERGEYKQALDLLTRQTSSAADGPSVSVDRAETLNVLGDAYFELGRYTPARVYYTRAVNMSRSIFGPQHPRVAENDIDLGHIEIQLRLYQVEISIRATHQDR